MLVVTVTPDRFVNKGRDRPVFPDWQRAEVVSGLRDVDWASVNRFASAVETLALLRPSVFIKGDEYETDAMRVNPNFLQEMETAREFGTEVAFTREERSSSTSAFQRIRTAAP